jgi:hypothetical protein
MTVIIIVAPFLWRLSLQADDEALRGQVRSLRAPRMGSLEGRRRNSMGFCAISFHAIGIPDTDVVGVPLVELHIKQFSLPITAIQSAALSADAKQTEFCAYLSAILLCGLLLKVLFGWWLADPVAALIMVPIIAREGVNALRGKSCGACDCQ